MLEAAAVLLLVFSCTEPWSCCLWLEDHCRLEQTGQGRAGLQAAQGRVKGFYIVLWNVSAALEGFSCRT